jgi:hypothetical protein
MKYRAHKTDLDQGFLPGRSDRTPILVTDLLAKLNVAERSPQEQRDAVNQWLEWNAPNRLLRDDLRDHGLLGEEKSTSERSLELLRRLRRRTPA